MTSVYLENIPYQEVAFGTGVASFRIVLRSFGESDEELVLFATVYVDGELVSSSVRCVNGSWLIPHPYLTRFCGNFRFECSDEEYPHYANFGTSCNLVYYEDDEYMRIVEGVS